ncbi:MAG: membrane protein insertion efficiency factor YidD [Elusimicrobia bacterium]|nr:MAG: membrane protein insertion efficiency factor YidD [Elusimicrobiota bacterium]
MRTAALFLIRAYRLLVSPFLGAHCRFAPTCSAYAEEAFRIHPVSRALRLSATRLFGCHPFNPGGIDPVPTTHG